MSNKVEVAEMRAFIRRNRRGVTLIEALLAMFLLAVAGLVFSASMPVASSCSRQAQEYKIATSIATKKMEQIRSLRYELLTPALLYTNGVIDSSAGTTRFYFTTTDGVASKLTKGTGTLYVYNTSSDTKRVTVLVRWRSSQRNIYRNVRLTSLVVDKRMRKAG